MGPGLKFLRQARLGQQQEHLKAQLAFAALHPEDLPEPHHGSRTAISAIGQRQQHAPCALVNVHRCHALLEECSARPFRMKLVTVLHIEALSQTQARASSLGINATFQSCQMLCAASEHRRAENLAAGFKGILLSEPHKRGLWSSSNIHARLDLCVCHMPLPA